MSSLLRLRCAFALSHRRPASTTRTTWSTLAAARATLRTRTMALGPIPSKSSSSAASSYPSWKPGDPVVFASSRAVAVAMQQKTLDATWSKSPWQPGMPVEILQPSKQRVSNNNNSKKRDAKAKKEESSSQSSLETFWAPTANRKRSDKKATPPKQRSTTTPRSPIVLEDSFDSGHASLGDKSASSASTTNATLGDKVDYDSSIELIQHKASPLSSALRHFALGQQHLQEAIAQRNDREQSCLPSTSTLSSSPLPDFTSIFEKPRSPPRPIPLSPVLPPPLTKSRSQSRPMSTTSRSHNAQSKAQPAVDWDDPVLTASLADLSGSSDLPDWPPHKTSKSSSSTLPSTTLDKGKGKAVARQPFQAITPASIAQAKPAAKPAAKPVAKTAATKADTKFIKEVKAESRHLRRAENSERAQAKAAESERLKGKYRQFSWEKEASVAPKVWYYQGKDALFKHCDTKSSHVEEKTMDEVAASLKGPLGFDLEWSTTPVWNSDFSRKDAQAPTGLVQLGDHHNIILYQLSGAGCIPACLVRIIEDPEIIKLGVQIKGDGNKLDRDFSTKDKPIRPRGCLELSDLAKYVDAPRYAGRGGLIGLQKLVADWLERYLDKGDERTSNWDAELTAMQRRYAANDVYCAVRLYHRIMGYAQELEGPLDFSHCIHDLCHKQSSTGAWKSIGWQARGAVAKRRSAGSKDSEVSRKQWDQASTVSRRQLEAWEHWYLNDKERDEVAKEMGIKPATIVAYIINALSTDRGLPFQHDRLKILTQGVFLRPEMVNVLAEILARPQNPEEGEDEEEDET